MSKMLLFPDIDTSPSLTATANCTCIEPIWQEGRLIGNDEFDFSNLEFKCETLPAGEMTDFAATDLGAPIISQKLKDTLQSLNTRLQYFPAKIVVKPGTQAVSGYYVANVVGLIDCIDFGKSDLEVEEEDGEIVDIIEVRTLVLDETEYGDIYRMYMFERVIVLEAQVASKLSEMNVSGMKLIAPEKWDGIASEKGS